MFPQRNCARTSGYHWFIIGNNGYNYVGGKPDKHDLCTQAVTTDVGAL